MRRRILSIRPDTPHIEPTEPSEIRVRRIIRRAQLHPLPAILGESLPSELIRNRPPRDGRKDEGEGHRRPDLDGHCGADEQVAGDALKTCVKA